MNVTTDETRDLSLGEYIRYLRERAGMTQRDVAQAIRNGGVHPQLISNIERGIYVPNDRICTELALVFNIQDKHELIIRKLQQWAPPEARGKIGLAAPSGSSAPRSIPILNPRNLTLEALLTSADFSHEAVSSSIAYSEIRDPKAFGIIAQDNSNAPKVEEGDLVLFGPSSSVAHGDLCCILQPGKYSIRLFQLDPRGVLFRCADPARSIEFHERDSYKAMIDQKKLRIFPALAVIKTLKAG